MLYIIKVLIFLNTHLAPVSSYVYQFPNITPITLRYILILSSYQSQCIPRGIYH